MKRWVTVVPVAAIIASGCSQDDHSLDHAVPPSQPKMVSDRTVADVPSVTDPDFYSDTCTLLRHTQDVTGLHPGSSDSELRAFLIAQEQASWWVALDVGRQDTYVRAARDFTGGRC